MDEEIVVRAVDTGRRITKYTYGVDADGTPRGAMFPWLAILTGKELTFDGLDRRPKTVDIPLDGLFYTAGPDVRPAIFGSRSISSIWATMNPAPDGLPPLVHRQPLATYTSIRGRSQFSSAFGMRTGWMKLL